jgi:hypothetical protein
VGREGEVYFETVNVHGLWGGFKPWVTNMICLKSLFLPFLPRCKPVSRIS